ncbi:hypothetical protein HDV06_005147 [Boothiomyces sp. JEL0866]|nr:hypothetical protein HDV06_005147 [Boothiomyces sp. JEL0866]
MESEKEQVEVPVEKEQLPSETPEVTDPLEKMVDQVNEFSLKTVQTVTEVYNTTLGPHIEAGRQEARNLYTKTTGRNPIEDGDYLKKVAHDSLTSVQTTATETITKLQPPLEEAGKTVTTQLQAGVTAAGEGLQVAGHVAAETLSKLQPPLKEAGKAAFTTVQKTGEKINEISKEVVTSATPVVQKIGNDAKTVYDKTTGRSADKDGEFIKTTTLGAVATTLKGVDKVVEKLSEATGRDLKHDGENIALGVKTATKTVEDFVKKLPETLGLVDEAAGAPTDPFAEPIEKDVTLTNE